MTKSVMSHVKIVVCLSTHFPNFHQSFKEVFLKELEKAFINFQHTDDTELIIYEGQCVGENSPDFGKKRLKICSMIWKYKIRKVDMISFIMKYCIALVFR